MCGVATHVKTPGCIFPRRVSAQTEQVGVGDIPRWLRETVSFVHHITIARGGRGATPLSCRTCGGEDN